MSLEQQLLAWCQDSVRAGRRAVIGLNGPVGAGKSTLSRKLRQACSDAGVQLAVASIDDAYLPWSARLQAMAGNPFAVNRVPPGSHEPEALLAPIHRWKQDPTALLALPRFDKTLRQGDGDRTEPWRGPAEVLLLEGWFVGCRPLPRQWLEDQLSLRDEFTPEQCRWALHCNEALTAYQPLWEQLDQLVMLWPLQWTSPRRWRFQAEARQRRRGGGWMDPEALNNLVQASLQSLPADLHQRDVLSRAEYVRVLDGLRRAVWEGSGSAALQWLAQLQPSVSSSATG